MAQLRKLRWNTGLTIGEVEAQAEQSYWDTKRTRHFANEHGEGIVSGLLVTETAPASTSVNISSGRALDASGNSIWVEAAQVLSLGSLVGTVYIYIEFVEVLSTPYVPSGGSGSGSGSGIDYKYNLDSFTITASTVAPSGDQVELARIVRTGAAIVASDAADADGPVDDEIGLRYREYLDREGFKLRTNDNLPDTNLSTVTVGEVGCDFDDLEEAISYVSNLTQSITRQCAILLFEKKNGSSWTSAAAIILPPYIHLIGVGKPAITFPILAGHLVTVEEGASFENIHLCVSTGWTSVLYTEDDDVTFRNVDVELITATDVNSYAFRIGAADRFKMLNCKLFQESTPKGTYGISLSGAEDFIIENCYLEGTENLLTASSASKRGHINNVTLKSSYGSSATWGAGRVQGQHHQISNLYAYVTAGASIGLSLEGTDGFEFNVSNIIVEPSVSNDTIAALILDYCHVSNVITKEGRMRIRSSCTVTGGEVLFTGALAVEALAIDGPGNIISGLRIDRGAQALACIHPAEDEADENQIIGCRCINDGTVPCIDNTVAACTDWLLVGNIVSKATLLGNDWDIVGEKVI